MTAAPSRIGRKPVFNEDSLGAAALDVGLPNITVAAVAKRVGVRSSALYRLVNDRSDLVMLAVERIASRTQLMPDTGTGWREVLHDFAGQLWQICETYPGFSDALITAPGTLAAFTDHVAAIARCLTAHGFTTRQARFAIAVVGDCVVGTHRVLSALPSVPEGNQRPETGGESAASRRDPARWENELLSVKIGFIVDALANQRPGMPEFTGLLPDTVDC